MIYLVVTGFARNNIIQISKKEENGMCKVKMAFGKETKGTICFKEVVKDGSAPIIGTLYVPKKTLEIKGYEPGDGIIVQVDLEKGGSAAVQGDKTAEAAAPAKGVKAPVKKAPAKRGRPKKAAAAKQ